MLAAVFEVANARKLVLLCTLVQLIATTIMLLIFLLTYFSYYYY